MKKVLKVLGVLVVLFIAALIIIPFAFKGKIVELIKTQANENLNARMDFADVNLSLIRNFPNLSIGIEELSIVGIAPFDGDTLTYMQNLGLTVNLMSVISGDQIKVNKITLDQPYVHVKVLKDGTANYDIAKPSADTTTAAATAEEAGGSVSLKIKEYSINGGKIVYDDASLAMLMVLDGLDHMGKGDFAEEVFTLYTQSSIEKVDVVYEGVKYIRRAQADLKADLAMDMANMKFTFMENELSLNQLTLGFDGWLAMPADDIDMDITYQTRKTDLVTILSLVPADFTADLEGVKANGTVNLSGYVKGIYNDNSMPGFGVDFGIEKGSVQYPDLPRSIENIDILAKIASPEGNDMDLMTVDVPRFHMEIGKTAANPNTIDANLSLRRPMSDPLIKTKVDADLDLGSFKDVIPMEEAFTLKGLISAHFALDGAMSAIENQRFNDFKAEGAVSVDDMLYADEEMSVAIAEARAAFTPQRLNLETLKLNYDEINMAMDGYVENYVAYALTDTTLKGVFNFSADRIDANKYMETDSAAATVAETDTISAPSGEPLLVPANLDVVLNATIGEILYDKVVLTDIKGQVAVQNQVAALRKLTFQTLGGSVQMDGSYSTQDEAKPRMDFAYDIRNIDLRAASDAFNTIEKLAPISKHASGAISSTFTLTTELTPAMDPVYETMEGRGSLSTKNLVLEGGKFLEKLSSTLKAPQLARQEISDLKASFVISEGKLVTDPFDVKINKMTANISGYSSFDETLDYMMKMNIPRSELGGDFNNMAEGLMAQANAFLGGNMSLGETINMDVRVHGDLYDPTISPAFAGMEGMGASLQDQAKEAVKEVVEEKIEEVKDQAKEEASKQAEKILAEAQIKADQVKKESAKAAKQIREEADKNAQKLMDEAKNPIAKAGAKIAAEKLKNEAYKQADNVEKEGVKQADDIMAKARAEADKLK